MASTSAPIASPFKFDTRPSSIWGGDTTSRPKSPKQTTIENPFLKNAQFASRGSSLGSGTPQSSFMTRSPLTPLGAMNTPAGNGGLKSSLRKPSQVPSPMAPPKTSLSLNESSIFQMQAPAPAIKTPAAQRSPAPMTVGPSHVQSPQYASARTKSIANTFTGASASFASSAGDGNWVVGFGFGPTSMGQYQELVSALSACGTIEQRISGGNWVAVQFNSPYAAEKAVASQPIYSPASNTYFGISRLSTDRLRILQLHKSNDAAASKSLENGSATESGQRQKSFDAYPVGKTLLEEKDVLLGDAVDEDIERPKEPRNICEWVMSLVFGWQYDAELIDKVHTD